MRRPLFVCSFCLVIMIVFWNGRAATSRGVGPPDGTRVNVTGKVCQKDESSFQIKVTVTDLWQDNPNIKLICEYENADRLILDSTVCLEGVFRAYTPATNPGEFDYAQYYGSLGCVGKMQDVRILAWDGKKAGLREWLYGVRCFWEGRLYHVFPQKEASVMTAILLGDKTGLDADLKALYKRNGIIHILSISGLHITLLGMGVYHRLRKLGLPVWAAALSGSILLMLYGMLTGFGISACRAIGMYLIRMLAQALGRTYDMLTALGVMAVILLCMHPAWITNMGFQLSFGAILGVGGLLPVLEQSLEQLRTKGGKARVPRLVEEAWKKRLIRLAQMCGRGLRQGMLAGLSVTLTTLPIQLWFSYEVPVYSLFLNILILPFMSLVMVAGLIAMMIPGFGFVGTIDVLILAGYEALCKCFEKLPHPMWNPGRPEVWKIVLYYLIWIFVVAGLRLVKKYQGQVLKFVLLALAVAVVGMPHFHGNTVTFLDVGQGDGICLQLASGEVYLFDCGSTTRSKIGERVLIPFLKYHGISRVDAVFISHADKDHISGLLELFALSEEEHIRVGRVVLPELDSFVRQEEFAQILRVMDQMDAPPCVTYISAGVNWRSCGTDPVSFLCLHPEKGGENKGGNAGSECFYIDAGGRSLLLTGDVEGTGETALLDELQRYGITGIDFLKCAHHGSAGTNGEELLGQISPVYTIISCGQNNPYGHPHRELLERLEQVQTLVWRTDEVGAVTIDFKGNIRGFREN